MSESEILCSFNGYCWNVGWLIFIGTSPLKVISQRVLCELIVSHHWDLQKRPTIFQHILYFLLFFAPLIAVFSHDVATERPSPVVAVMAFKSRLKIRSPNIPNLLPLFHHLLNCCILSRPSLFHISPVESAPGRSCLLARKSIGTLARWGAANKASNSFLTSSSLASSWSKNR